MSEIKLIRIYQDYRLTLGKIIVNHQLVCFALELPWRNNERFISCIPPGEYEYKKYFSEKYKCECLALYDVLGHEYICCHPGNKLKDTKGCVLTGTEIGINKTINSRKALKYLLSQIGKEGVFKVEIGC